MLFWHRLFVYAKQFWRQNFENQKVDFNQNAKFFVTLVSQGMQAVLINNAYKKILPNFDFKNDKYFIIASLTQSFNSVFHKHQVQGMNM
jgi:hypothetical protein